MVARSELMAAGIPGEPAGMLGTALNSALSAAGTTQGTATAMKGCGFAIVTTVALNSGIILDPPSGGSPNQVVVNAGANVLTIYPSVGATINALAVNIGVQLAPGKAAFFPGHGKNYAGIIGG